MEAPLLLVAVLTIRSRPAADQCSGRMGVRPLARAAAAWVFGAGPCSGGMGSQRWTEDRRHGQAPRGRALQVWLASAGREASLAPIPAPCANHGSIAAVQPGYERPPGRTLSTRPAAAAPAGLAAGVAGDRSFRHDKGFIYAGYIAFASLFALFPFLLFLVTLAGFLGQGEAAAASIELALELLPPEVAGVLRPVIDEVRNNASTSLLTLSIGLTLWFSSSGFESLRSAVNLAYDVTQYPHFVWSRLQSMLLTIVLGRHHHPGDAGAGGGAAGQPARRVPVARRGGRAQHLCAGPARHRHRAAARACSSASTWCCRTWRCA